MFEIINIFFQCIFFLNLLQINLCLNLIIVYALFQFLVNFLLTLNSYSCITEHFICFQMRKSNNFANKKMYDEFVFIKSQLLFFKKKRLFTIKNYVKLLKNIRKI